MPTPRGDLGASSGLLDRREGSGPDAGSRGIRLYPSGWIFVGATLVGIVAISVAAGTRGRDAALPAPTSRVLVLVALVATCVAVTLVARGAETQLRILVDVVVKTLLSLAALLLPGFFVVKLARPRVDADLALVLGMPATVVVFGLLFLLLFSLEAPPLAYAVVNGFALAAIGVVALRRHAARDLARISPNLRFAVQLVLLACIAASSFVTLGRPDPAATMDWSTVATRGMVNLAADNLLQFDTMRTLATNAPPWRWPDDDWTMGDRPPLLGALNAIVALSLLQPATYSFWSYQLFSTVCNALFFLPLIALAERVLATDKAVRSTAVLLFLNAFVFVNVYFTWPKLFGVYFLLAATYLLARRGLGVASAAVAGVLVSLGGLCHGATFLSLPVLGLVACVALVRSSRVPPRRLVLCLLAFGVTVVAVQSPWALYKQRHPEIDTSRLAYHYIAPEYLPRGLFTTTAIRDALLQFLRQHPLRAQIAQRSTNVRAFLGGHNLGASLRGALGGDLTERAVWRMDLGAPLHALGGLHLWLALAALAWAVLTARPPWSTTPGAAATWIVVPAACFASLLVNVALKWRDIDARGVPSFEIVLLLAFVYGLSCRFDALRLAALAVSLLQFFDYVFTTTFTHRQQLVDFSSVVVTACVGVMIVLTLLPRGERAAADSV